MTLPFSRYRPDLGYQRPSKTTKRSFKGVATLSKIRDKYFACAGLLLLVPPHVETISVANWMLCIMALHVWHPRSACVSSVTQGHRGEWVSLLSYFSACFKTLVTKPSCFVCSADKDTALYVYEVQFFRRRMCAVYIRNRKIITDKSWQMSDLKVTLFMC